MPLTRTRLKVYGELLQVLGNALLGENFRARQHERVATRLAAADQAKDDFLAMLPRTAAFPDSMATRSRHRFEQFLARTCG
ncbi:MAG: hypothetical protein ACREJ4_07105 [Candidatus Methylomirabilaceae bacterium]